MSAIDEIKEINSDVAEDPEVKELSESLDIAEELAQFSNTPAGKATIKKLQGSLYATLNELFGAYRSENPSLNGLIAIIARLESQSQMLAKFGGAKTEADSLLSMLQDKLKEKSG